MPSLNFAIANDRKNVYNFRTVHARQEMCIEHQEETVVTLSIGDVTSGLVRPLAAEIGKIVIVYQRETPITSERYPIDAKRVLNTNSKPWW
jgi:hypothetical protein